MTHTDPEIERLARDRDRDFGPFYNWCDRRCSRCELEHECNLAHRMGMLRWAMTELAADPERAEHTLGGIWHELETAFGLALELEAREEQGEQRAGDAATENATLRERSELGRRLCLMGVEYSAAVRAFTARVIDEAGQFDARSLSASDLDIAGGMLAVKMTDVADAIARGDWTGGEPASDRHKTRAAWASLLAVEELDAECIGQAEALAEDSGVSADELGQARARLRDAIAPLLASVPFDVRARIDELVAAELAPSPFLNAEA